MSQPDPFATSQSVMVIRNSNDKSNIITPDEGPSFSSPDETVTIYAGEEKKPFVIHKEVAMYSPVLRAAFNSGFVEGQNWTYNLEHTTVGAFQLLVQWLYGRTFKPFMTQGELDSLPVEVDGLRQPGYDVHLKILDRQRNLIELWVLADYLQIPEAQNLAVDELEQIRKDWGGIGFLRLEYIYESVADGAPLRELLFEHCWRFLDPIFYRSCPEYFSKKMLLEYFIRDKLSKQSSMHDPFTNRAEFVKRFHVPENRANSSSERSV